MESFWNVLWFLYDLSCFCQQFMAPVRHFFRLDWIRTLPMVVVKGGSFPKVEFFNWADFCHIGGQLVILVTFFKHHLLDLAHFKLQMFDGFLNILCSAGFATLFSPSVNMIVVLGLLEIAVCFFVNYRFKACIVSLYLHRKNKYSNRKNGKVH